MPNVYTNLAELRQGIIDHLDRNDLAVQVDNFIGLAEVRIQRDTRLREFIQRAPLTLDARFVALPTGIRKLRGLRILTDADGNPVPWPVTYVNLYEMTRLRRCHQRPGIPSHFTRHGNEIELDRDPDQDYGAEIAYSGTIPPLTDAAPVNDLLTRAPDVYLYGALAAAAPFLPEDERIQVWGSGYASAVTALRAEDLDDRYVGPLVSRIDGATP